MHIIDISDPTNPDVIAFVDTPCGSHTETLVPDLENDRLLVYSNSSANTTFGVPGGGEIPLNCRGIDIIEVPLDDPADASYLRFERSGDPDEDIEHSHSCHDTSVILGDANLVSCTGSGGPGNGASVFTIDPALGGSKEDPKWLYHKVTGGISLGHSSSFTWDGEVLVISHEPGGGVRRQLRGDRQPARADVLLRRRRHGRRRSASSRSHGRRRTSRTARPTTTTSSRFATGT